MVALRRAKVYVEGGGFVWMIPFGGGVKRAWSSGVEGAICSLLRFRSVGRCLAVKETVRSARGGLMAQSG